MIITIGTKSATKDLLSKANMPTLHVSMAIETFKILYKISPVYLHDFISFKNTNNSFRYENLLDVPRVRPIILTGFKKRNTNFHFYLPKDSCM